MSTTNKLSLHQKFKKSRVNFFLYKLYYNKILFNSNLFCKKNKFELNKIFYRTHIIYFKKLFLKKSKITFLLYLSLIFQFF